MGYLTVNHEKSQLVSEMWSSFTVADTPNRNQMFFDSIVR